MMMPRRAYLHLMLVTFLGLCVSSCGSSTPHAMTVPIGQRIQVGKLFYQVVEAQWVGEVEGAKQPPKNRILQLHLTVTNSGAEDASIPFLKLFDSKGNEIPEVSDLEANRRWMGALRRLQPALTEDAWIFFDVPVGTYKLEVVDNGDPNDERLAMIEIPASLAPPVALEQPARPGQ